MKRPSGLQSQCCYLQPIKAAFILFQTCHQPNATYFATWQFWQNKWKKPAWWHRHHSNVFYSSIHLPVFDLHCTEDHERSTAWRVFTVVQPNPSGAWRPLVTPLSGNGSNPRTVSDKKTGTVFLGNKVATTFPLLRIFFVHIPIVHDHQWDKRMLYFKTSVEEREEKKKQIHWRKQKCWLMGQSWENHLVGVLILLCSLSWWCNWSPLQGLAAPQELWVSTNGSCVRTLTKRKTGRIGPDDSDEMKTPLQQVVLMETWIQSRYLCLEKVQCYLFKLQT